MTETLEAMSHKLPFSGQDFTKNVHDVLKEQAGHIDVVQLSKFCGPRVEAVRGWMANHNPPGGGKVTLKLAYFLREMGFEAPALAEVRRRRPIGALIGELLAFEVISMTEAQKLAGNVVSETVLAAARGQDLERHKNGPEALAGFRRDNPDLETLLIMARNDLRAKIGLEELPLNYLDGVSETPPVYEHKLSHEPVAEPAQPEPLPHVTAQPAAPAVPTAVTRPEHDQLEHILRENRSQLTAALQEIMAQLQPALKSKALPDSSTEADEAKEGKEVPEELTVEMLRFLNEAADKVRQASMVVKILLEHTSPEVRALFRGVLDASELRLLINRLSKVTNEHANSFRGNNESGE